jgi:hypothetical protein
MKIQAELQVVLEEEVQRGFQQWASPWAQCVNERAILICN